MYPESETQGNTCYHTPYEWYKQIHPESHGTVDMYMYSANFLKHGGNHYIQVWTKLAMTAQQWASWFNTRPWQCCQAEGKAPGIEQQTAELWSWSTYTVWQSWIMSFRDSHPFEYCFVMVFLLSLLSSTNRWMTDKFEGRSNVFQCSCKCWRYWRCLKVAHLRYNFITCIREVAYETKHVIKLLSQVYGCGVSGLCEVLTASLLGIYSWWPRCDMFTRTESRCCVIYLKHTSAGQISPIVYMYIIICDKK